MTDEQLQYFKDMLTGQYNELLNQANATVSDMTERPQENYSDPTDRAAVESDRNFTLRLRERERFLLVKIQEALQRLEDGTFGICEDCGDEISFKRLKARPVTTLCIDCKTKAEAMEKARGE